MPDDASAAGEPAALAGRVRSALESGDLDAIRDLLDHSARWGAPEGVPLQNCRMVFDLGFMRSANAAR